MTDLFSPISLGRLNLKNRLFMAPLTRGRADKERAPQSFVADYYAQRASVGLIISEATAVSAEGAGWLNAPGIYSDRQKAAWAPVTRKTKDAGAPMFMQIWHMGRQVHPAYIENNTPVAPSAIAGEGALPGPDGVSRPFATPRALETGEVPLRVEQFVDAARAAVEAGFMGVEIHAANGFLIEQFLRDGSNKRTDKYGGTLAKRARFLFDVVDSVSAAIGSDRVGVRISPTAILWGLTDSNLEATYKFAVKGLNERGLAYLHVLEPPAGSGHPLASEHPAMGGKIRDWYDGVIVLNGGYTRGTAQAALKSGLGDVVAFGTPLIANPDFVRRARFGLPLADPNPDLFYTNGREGYTDYPPYRGEDDADTVADAA